MVVKKSISPADSIEQILAALSAGERLFFCAPTTQQGKTYVVPLINSLPRGSTTLLISTEAIDRNSLPENVTKLIDLSTPASGKNSVAGLRREADHLPKSSTVLWISLGEGSRSGSFELLERAARGFRQPLIGLVSQESLTQTEVSLLKDDADYFVQINNIGTITYLQFLAAKGISCPEFFLPRVLSFPNGTLELGPPIVPAIPSGGSAEVQGGTPTAIQYTVTDLLEQKYHKIFDLLSSPVITFKLGENYFEANKAAYDLIGYSPGERPGLKMADFVPAISRTNLLRALVTLQRKGRVMAEIQVNRKNGRRLDLRLHLSRVDKDLFVGTASDVTGYNKSALSLIQKEAEFDILIHNNHKTVQIPTCMSLGSNKPGLPGMSCIGLLNGDNIEKSTASCLVAPNTLHIGDTAFLELIPDHG